MRSEAVSDRRRLAQKILVGVLVMAHAGWVATHLSLVAEGRVNPWKLGGYGMYTVPNPLARTHAYVFEEASQSWREVPRTRFNSFRFDSANDLHVFRCTVPSEESLVGFLDENPHLRRRSLAIALSEVVFLRDPVGVRREIYGRLQIGWAQDGSRFGYRGRVCDTEFSGEVAYSPPD